MLKIFGKYIHRLRYFVVTVVVDRKVLVLEVETMMELEDCS